MKHSWTSKINNTKKNIVWKLLISQKYVIRTRSASGIYRRPFGLIEMIA